MLNLDILLKIKINLNSNNYKPWIRKKIIFAYKRQRFHIQDPEVYVIYGFGRAD